MLEWLIMTIAQPDSTTVVDLRCGSGSASLAALRMGFNAVAVDMSSKQVAVCNYLSNSYVMQCTVCELITCIFVWCSNDFELRGMVKQHVALHDRQSSQGVEAHLIPSKCFLSAATNAYRPIKGLLSLSNLDETIHHVHRVTQTSVSQK